MIKIYLQQFFIFRILGVEGNVPKTLPTTIRQMFVTVIRSWTVFESISYYYTYYNNIICFALCVCNRRTTTVKIRFGQRKRVIFFFGGSKRHFTRPFPRPLIIIIVLIAGRTDLYIRVPTYIIWTRLFILRKTKADVLPY